MALDSSGDQNPSSLRKGFCGQSCVCPISCPLDKLFRVPPGIDPIDKVVSQQDRRSYATSRRSWLLSDSVFDHLIEVIFKGPGKCLQLSISTTVDRLSP